MLQSGYAWVQELTYWAEGSPEHQLRRNTLDAIPTLYEDAFNDPGEGWEGSGALGHLAASPGASPGPSPMSQSQSPMSPGDPAHILHSQSPSHSQKDARKSEDGDSIFSVKGISRECQHFSLGHHAFITQLWYVMRSGRASKYECMIVCVCLCSCVTAKVAAGLTA